MHHQCANITKSIIIEKKQKKAVIKHHCTSSSDPLYNDAKAETGVTTIRWRSSKCFTASTPAIHNEEWQIHDAQLEID